MPTTRKTITLTYSGGFHNLGPITLRVKLALLEGEMLPELSSGQIAKLHKHFSGMDDCSCGYRRAEVDGEKAHHPHPGSPCNTDPH